jgi:hypothetical protein
VSPELQFAEARERERDFIVRDVIVAGELPLCGMPVRGRQKWLRTGSRLRLRLITSFGSSHFFVGRFGRLRLWPSVFPLRFTQAGITDTDLVGRN